MRGCQAAVRESAHQRLNATKRLALQRRAVHLRSQNLIRTHTVSNEIEDILNFGYGRGIQNTEYSVQTNNENSFHIGDWLLVIGYWLLSFDF